MREMEQVIDQVEPDKFKKAATPTRADTESDMGEEQRGSTQRQKECCEMEFRTVSVRAVHLDTDRK